MNHDLLLRNRFVMSGEALDVNFHRFPNILQRLSLRFALAVASSESGTEGMITPNRFLLQNYGIVHLKKLLGISEIVKFQSSRFSLHILHSAF